MKQHIYPAVLSLVLLAVQSPAAERVLRQWDFSTAADTLGWTAAEPTAEFAVIDGALAARAAPGYHIKLESPLFDIPATPWQRVEIELSSDTGGAGLMYYSNTTQEPYHGFRPGQYFQFTVEAGEQFRKNIIYPFWHRHRTMTHIRFDPPGNSVRIRSIRIVEPESSEPRQRSSWSFINSDQGWRALAPAADTEIRKDGLRIGGNRDAVVLSPPVAIDADRSYYVSLRIQGRGTALFRWASDASDGLHGAPLRLTGDDRTHTYLLDLSESAEWTGKVIAVGISPTDSTESASLLVESVQVSDGPCGPPDFEITWVGWKEPFVRAGAKRELVAEVRNNGGSPASATAAAYLGGCDDTMRTLQPERKTIAPGSTGRFTWRVDPGGEGVLRACCQIRMGEVQHDEKTAALRVYPPPDPKAVAGVSYVPEPVAPKSDYLVGAYYYPGWPTYDRWAVLDAYPERRPVLGYYREGDPEVADWHIYWALSHGISYFIYDWYWSKGARQLEHGLHDGFLKSKYQDRFKFCLLWANHNPAGTSSEQDCLDVTRYWIDKYFRLPNYLKIGGRNVMVIFSPNRLTEDMGVEGVRAAFTKMRKLCEDAGVGGLYLVACTYPGEANIRNLEAEGYDALSGYNYPPAGNRGQRYAPYEWMVDGYKDYWTRIAGAASIPYIPVCEPGWDARPWHGHKSHVRTGKSPELWRKMLTNARQFVDAPGYKPPEGAKLVFLEAWNEWGEGDYIEPHAEFGFEYLEAVRSVFAPESSRPHIIVPGDIGMGPYELKKPAPRTSWDFSRRQDQTWHVGNMVNLSYEGGVMSAEAANNDPAFYSPLTDIDADRFRTIEIRMRMDRGGEGQLFFSRPRGQMTEEKSVRFPVTGDGEFHTYVIDLSRQPRWRGSIGHIRLDPNSAQGSKVEIASIRLK